jgi:fatty-acid desaturase
MWRQARGRSPTLVEGQTDDTPPKANEPPWTKPWWQPSEGNGATLFYIVMIHALALVGLVLFPLPGWRVLAVALAVAAIGGVGTSVCYHRCLAHRSLRLNPVVENVLIFFTIFNASGAPLTWVAQHRNHHAKADTAEDISSPRHGGFWWAHVRWVYQWSGSEVRRWCPDLDKPRYRIWRPLQIPIILLSIFSGLVMGWEGFFWIGAIPKEFRKLARGVKREMDVFSSPFVISEGKEAS